MKGRMDKERNVGKDEEKRDPNPKSLGKRQENHKSTSISTNMGPEIDPKGLKTKPRGTKSQSSVSKTTW